MIFIILLLCCIFVHLGAVEWNLLAEVVVHGRQDKVEVVLLTEAKQDVLHGATGALVHFQEAHLGLRKAHRKQPRVQQPAQTCENPMSQLLIKVSKT